MKKILALAIFAAAATCMAQNRNVDVEIFGIKERVPLTPGKSHQGISADNPVWLEENKEYYLCAFGGPVTEDWTAYEFSFIPEEDGNVTLFLRGPLFVPEKSPGSSPIWVAYDNLVITGAELENPDFENGQLDGWKCIPGNIVKDPGGAQSGKTYVKALHDLPVAQDIQVKKGEEVTIQFQVKAVEEKK
jgi:hypothetical protein